MTESSLLFEPMVREGYLSGADNVRLFYRVVGTSPNKIVVLHGGPGLHTNCYLPDLLPLAADNTLIFYDQRGAGQSEVIKDSHLLDAQQNVDDLDAVRQHLEIDELTLLGHSWGSGLAALYAMQYPQHVARLILVGSISPRATPYMEQFGEGLMSRLDEEARAWIGSFDERRREYEDPIAAQRVYWQFLGPAYFSDPSSITKMKGDFCAAPAETVNPVPLINAVIGSLGDWDWRSKLATVQVPTLIIHGDNDPIPLESAREWAAALPIAHLEVIEAAGHCPFIEQPEQFFATVRRFLKHG